MIRTPSILGLLVLTSQVAWAQEDPENASEPSDDVVEASGELPEETPGGAEPPTEDAAGGSEDATAEASESGGLVEAPPGDGGVGATDGEPVRAPGEKKQKRGSKEVDKKPSGPPPERVGLSEAELRNFKQTGTRFTERMEELRGDTKAFLDVREKEERDRVSAGYDALIGTLGDLEGTHRDIAIEQMLRFLARYPDTAYSSHVRFRLADLYFEVAKEDWLDASEEYARLEAELGFERMDELPPMPRIDLGPAVELYERIIADNRDLPRYAQYEPLDAAFYMLGFSYNDPNSSEQDEEFARKAFQDLVEVRPESDLADAAHLFLGNIYFDENRYQKAIDEYQSVLAKGDEGRYFSEALYQLAWAYYKLAGPDVTRFSMGPEAYDRALELFGAVLDESEELYLESGRISDFKPDAIKYIAISFADIADNTGIPSVKVADAYFQHVQGKVWERDIYVSLGAVLTEMARYGEAIQIYERLQEDERWVNEPDNPDHQFQVAKLWASGPYPDLAKSGAARVELTERYNSDSSWWTSNLENPEALARARSYIEDSLADVAIEFRLEADESGDHDRYMDAADKFREYLDKFPISEDYYLQQWYLADTLLRAGEYRKAIDEYESLYRSAGNHSFGDGAVYFAFEAWFQTLQRDHVPPAIPVESLAGDLVVQAEGQKAPLWMVPRADLAERTVQPTPRVEMTVYALSEDHRAFVDAADRALAHEFGTPEDEKAVDVQQVMEERRYKLMYLVAQLLYFHNRFDDARPRMLEIIDRYSHRNEAAYAAGLLVDSYQREGDLAQVRAYTKRFMVLSLGEDAGLIGEKQDQFASLLEGTAFKQAFAFVELGDREAAAQAFLDFIDEFPDSEHVPKALYNAANNYELLGKAERANELFEEYVQRYPDDPKSKNLYFRLAENAEATFDLEKAIEYYMRLVSHPVFGEDPVAADALYNASFLRVGLGDHGGAARGFEQYAARYPEKSDVEEVFFQAGEQWELVGPDAARKFYEDYLRRYGLENPDHAFEAKHRVAKLYLEDGRDRTATDFLNEIVQDFETLAAEGVELGWASRHYAAESAFRMLQQSFDELTKDTLVGDEAKDMELLLDLKPPQVEAFEKNVLSFVQHYGDFEYSTAALYLAAASYLYYADLGFSIQPPPGLTTEEEDVYWMILEEKVLPQFYQVQDKARARFEAILKLSQTQKLYSEWVGAAQDALNRLDPRTYPQEKLEIPGSADASLQPELTPMRIEVEAPATLPSTVSGAEAAASGTGVEAPPEDSVGTAAEGSGGAETSDQGTPGEDTGTEGDVPGGVEASSPAPEEAPSGDDGTSPADGEAP